jgi:hypothetical protein
MTLRNTSLKQIISVISNAFTTLKKNASKNHQDLESLEQKLFVEEKKQQTPKDSVRISRQSLTKFWLW